MTSGESGEVALPVSQKWLERLLTEKYDTKGEILNCSCELIGEGIGFLSVITKVNIEWKEKEGPLPDAIVIKCPTEEKIKKIEEMKKLMESEPDMLKRTHNNEVSAYTYITKFGETPLPTADVIYLERMASDTDGKLVLGYVEGKNRPFSEENTLAQVETLTNHIANVQAYGIRHGQLDQFFSMDPIKQVDKLLKNSVSKYAKLTTIAPDLFPHPVETMTALVENARAFLSTILDVNLPYTPVLVLGDLQQNNIIWKTNADGSLQDVVSALVDFQICHRGSCMYDFGSVTFWGMLAADRKEHEDYLLDLFHGTIESKVGDQVPLSLTAMKVEYHKVMLVFAATFIQFLADSDDFKVVLGLSDDRIRQLREKVALIINDFADESAN